jgi:ABC-type amino acid transport substrate-binding protein
MRNGLFRQGRGRTVPILVIAALVAACSSGTPAASPTPAASAAASAATSTEASAGASAAPSIDTSAFNLVKPGTLTVATWGSSPPAITVEGNTIGGLDGLLINEFAKEAGLNVEVFSTDFAGTVLAVQQGRADIGTYFYYTPERSKTIFYPIPFIADYAVIVAKDPFVYTGPDSLKDIPLGAIAGSLYTPILEAAFPGQVQTYPDHATVAQALINGQVTAILEANSFIGTPSVASRSDIKIYPVESGDIPGLPDDQLVNPSYNPLPCDHKALADAMDATLQRVMQTKEWQDMMTAGQVVNPAGFEYKRPEQGC